MIAGYVVRYFGSDAGFLCLAGLATLAFAYFAIFMPETGEASAQDSGNHLKT